MKNYIVTGASRGLGLNIAEHLLFSDQRVFGISRKGNQELSRFPNYIDLKINISSFEQLSAFLQDVFDEYSPITGVIHAAAITGPMGKVEETLYSEWYKAIEINLLGTYNLLSIMAKHFRQNKLGNFVALSGGGATSAMPRMTAYAASKTAIVRLIESVARDFDEFPNVTFNSVAPGIMKTKMIDEIIEAGSDTLGKEYFSKIYDFRKNQSDSMPAAIELIDFLATNIGHKVNGKLISAVWDKWPELVHNPDYLSDENLHTLRRIVN